MVFTSDFDSGNMGHIELLSADSEDLLYVIDVAPDCAGTAHENGYKSWFFFGLSVAEPVEIAQATAGAEKEEHVDSSVKVVETANPSFGTEEGLVNATPSESAAGSDEETPDIADQPGSLDQALVDQAALDQLPETVSQTRPLELPEARYEVSMVITIRNLNNHRKLFRDGYRPWCKKSGGAWMRWGQKSFHSH